MPRKIILASSWNGGEIKEKKIHRNVHVCQEESITSLLFFYPENMNARVICSIN